MPARAALCRRNRYGSNDSSTVTVDQPPPTTTISTAGDDITATTRISGTLTDGTEVDITSHVVYTVRDGEVVRILSMVNPGDGPMVRKAFALAGFTVLGTPDSTE
jgi:ketosteroid isomerase-like protein